MERGVITVCANGGIGVAAVAAGETRGHFLASGRRLLAAGSRVRTDPATLEATPPQTATVQTTDIFQTMSCLAFRCHDAAAEAAEEVQ